MKDYICKLFSKQFIIFILIFLIIFGNVYSFANSNNLNMDENICSATLDDNFADDAVIVVIDKANSKINKKYKIENFPNVSEIKDLSTIKGTIEDKKYLNQSEYRQILKLTLKKKGKQEVLKTIRKLEKYDWIESAYPNYIYSSMVDKTEIIDFSINRMANPIQTDILTQINGDFIHELTEGISDIKIGIIDSGICEHNDLINNVVEGWDFVNNTSETTDDVSGHGTFIAGIIGGNSVGICKNISLVPLQVSHNNDATAEAVNLAFEYAINNNIDIVNLSLGGPFTELKNGIQNYSGLIVVASGNSYPNGRNIDNVEIYPASSMAENIICVASVDNNFKLATDSNYGMNNVDIAAPGENIKSTKKNSGYCRDSGTSYAAPVVTAVSALMKSINPHLDAVSIKNIILDTATVYNSLQGNLACGGVINAYDAIYEVYSNSIPKTLMGDINGDGSEDMVSVGAPNTITEGCVLVQMADGEGGFGNPYTSAVPVVSVLDDLWLEDVTGDGRDDLICRTLNSNMDEGGLIYVAPSNGTNFHYWSFSTPTNRLTVHDKILFGDVNGDNKADLICISAATQFDEGYVYTALSNGEGFDFWSSVSSRKVLNHGDKVYIGDVNGDNQDDIIATGSFAEEDAGRVYVARSMGNGFDFWTNSTPNQVLKNIDDKVLVGDINGDNCDDLVVHAGVNAWDTGYIWTALSNGDFLSFWTSHSNGSMVLENDKIILGDVNGDGCDDLISRGGEGNYDTGYIWCALSNEVNFDFWTYNSERKVVNIGDKIFIEDIDNNGTVDLVAIGGYTYHDKGYLYIAKSTNTGFYFWNWIGNAIGT